MKKALLLKANQDFLIFALLFVISWAVVGFGQPAWCSQLGSVASVCGFALLWLSVQRIKRGRFWCSSAWYSLVQMVQLSWLTSIEYQGYYILGVYLFLCASLGLQFGVLTHFFLRRQGSNLIRVLAVAGLWTLIEWSRLFILCGFSWNPVGLAMTGSLYFLQFAGVFGIYGLSFWVILVNGILFQALVSRFKLRLIGLWIGAVMIPCIYGCCALHGSWLSGRAQEKEKLSVGLVQTGLLPSQKVPLPGRSADYIAPLEQWKRIFSNLHVHNEKWDMIVLPEAVVPMRSDFCVYPYEMVLAELQQIYNRDLIRDAPPLKPPHAQVRYLQGAAVLCVSNGYLAQLISNIYKSEVVIGLDHYDPISGKNYNSAFYLSFQKQSMQRYDKQVLLPLAEYLPFGWLRALTKRYGITEFFSHGEQALVLGEEHPFSLCICYEETFPHLIRSGRIMGADFFVNVTNDNYYPFSKLPEQHFSHARVRAVENGVFLLRACNTGVTAVVDPFGRVAARLGDGSKASEVLQDVLTVAFPLESHQTLYMLWGDAAILCLAILGLVAFAFVQKKSSFPAPAVDLNLKKMDL